MKDKTLFLLKRKRGSISVISTVEEEETDDDCENENSDSEAEKIDRKKKINQVDTEVVNLLETLRSLTQDKKRHLNSVMEERITNLSKPGLFKR